MPEFRILLIEAPYAYKKGSIVVGNYFPLGIGYLAAFLRQKGYPVKIFQPADNKRFDQELMESLRNYNPDLVGISVMTSTYPKAINICGIIKKNSNARTIMGGHHISAVKKEVLEQSPDTDFAVVGEGELTMLDLINELIKSSPDLKSVKGLLWRDDKGNIQENEKQTLIKDLDKLPFPARDLVDISRFRLHSYIDFGKKSATMITSRGCPFKCLFCSSHLTMGSEYRFRSVENVLAEITEITNKYKIDHIVFEDDTMTLKRDRIEGICNGLIKMKNRPSWYCLSRVDAIDYDLAKLMKKAGCKMIAFGIESGSPEILKKIKKGISIERAKEAVKACSDAGLRTQCTFILGFPFDDEKTMEMTLEAAKNIGPTIAIFFPLTPYPGTEVYEKYLPRELHPKSGEEWGKFVMTCNNSELSTNERYSGNELKYISNLWNRKFYFRFKQVIIIFKTINNVSDFMNIFRGFLYLIQQMLFSNQ
ncbi:MAG: radical SAM protein [bacterium]|nr:radical SAM protein [bacterium]